MNNQPSRLTFALIALIWALSGNALFGQNALNSTAIVLSGHTQTDFKYAVAWLAESEGISDVQHNDPVIRFRYDEEANRLAAVEKLMHRSFTVSTKSGIPPDFPANPDHPDYEALKISWISDNSARYSELNQQTAVISISQDEFDLLTPEKQQFILERPEQYQIVP
jgi:hypothetical protein